MSSAFAWFLLSLKGRISRQEFWLGYVGAVLVILLLGRTLEDVSLHLLRPASRPWYRDELEFAVALSRYLASILMLWPLVAIYVKRLHDLNLSGWWLLVLPAIMVLAGMAGIERWSLATWLGVIVLGFVPACAATIASASIQSLICTRDAGMTHPGRDSFSRPRSWYMLQGSIRVRRADHSTWGHADELDRQREIADSRRNRVVDRRGSA